MLSVGWLGIARYRSCPCFTPVKSPQSNGISEAFVNTLKRDYVRVTPLPKAETVLGLIPGAQFYQEIESHFPELDLPSTVSRSWAIKCASSHASTAKHRPALTASPIGWFVIA